MPAAIAEFWWRALKEFLQYYPNVARSYCGLDRVSVRHGLLIVEKATGDFRHQRPLIGQNNRIVVEASVELVKEKGEMDKGSGFTFHLLRWFDN